MTKHSKNNTASSIFTYAEYKKLDYGTKRQRLGNESMRNFDACALCLNRAREPLICNNGHLFCKECVYSDLLSQKQSIKEQKSKIETLRKEAERERERARERARERVLADFEKRQLGLAGSTDDDINAEKVFDAQAGKKRKGPPSPSSSSKPFSFSQANITALLEKAEQEALKTLEEEQAETMKSKSPDFWLPSLTPTFSGPKMGEDVPQTLDDAEKKMDMAKTMCRGGGDPHVLSMKNLIPVNFTFYNSSASNGASTSTTSFSSSATSATKGERDPICPSCKKRLSNSVLLFLSRPCGHLVCKTCTDTLVRPSMQCIVCDVKLKSKDVIELKREGTGFAGGGLAETSRAGVAFQG